MSLIEHMPLWLASKAKIIGAEELQASLSPILGEEKLARYVEIDGNGLLSRATLWEDGALELEAVSERSGNSVIQASRLALSSAVLDDCLNWWLSEIVIYDPDET